MSYRDLWIAARNDDDIDKMISEEEFLNLLPSMIGKKANTDSYITAVKMRFGLAGKSKSTYKQIGEKLNISSTTARDKIEKILRILRHPKIYYLCKKELTKEERKTLEAYSEKHWSEDFSLKAQNIIQQARIDSMEECREFVSGKIRFKYGSVIDPRADDDDIRLSSMLYKRYSVDGFNELREFFRLPPVKLQERKYTDSEIKRMITVLEKLGYTVHRKQVK